MALASAVKLRHCSGRASLGGAVWRQFWPAVVHVRTVKGLVPTHAQASKDVVSCRQRRPEWQDGIASLYGNLPDQFTPATHPDFAPLTSNNFDASGKLPATLVLEGEVHAKGVGQLTASVDTNGDMSVQANSSGIFGIGTKAQLNRDADGSVTGSVDVHARNMFNGNGAVAVRGRLEADGSIDLYPVGSLHAPRSIDSNGSYNDTWDTPIQGELVFDPSTGSFQSGFLECDIIGMIKDSASRYGTPEVNAMSDFLKANNIDALQMHMAENGFGASVSIGGYKLSAERKSFDISGSREASTFERDETGAVTHYYGETEVTSGSVQASYLGFGLYSEIGAAGTSVQAKFNVRNDNYFESQKNVHEYHSSDGHVIEDRSSTAMSDTSSEGIFFKNTDVHMHKEQHSLDTMPDKVIESHITSDTTDNTTSFLGVKVSGEETVVNHTVTTERSQEQGWFTNTKTTKTTTEDVEYKQTHTWFDSDIDILRDTTETEIAMEHTLTEAGCGALVVAIKPAVKLHKVYMETGRISKTEASRALLQTGGGVATMAAVSRITGSGNAAMVVMMLAGVIPKIHRGDICGVRQDLQRLMFAVSVARGCNLLATASLHAAGLGPFANVGGTAAGILASTVAAEYLSIDKVIEQLKSSRHNQQRMNKMLRA